MGNYIFGAKVKQRDLQKAREIFKQLDLKIREKIYHPWGEGINTFLSDKKDSFMLFIEVLIMNGISVKIFPVQDVTGVSEEELEEFLKPINYEKPN